MESKFINSTVKADHNHNNFYPLSKLYYINNKVYECRYCLSCMPSNITFYEKNKHYTFCPECTTYTPLVDGPHVWCDECGTCTRSGYTHMFRHKAGECKACSNPEITEIDHSWCPICRVCRPHADEHTHYD